MTLSIWRYAHLAIAIITSLFLIVASSTGVILAYDAAQESLQPYKVENFDQIKLAECLPRIKETYPEITEISIDDNGFVLLDGSDAEGNQVKGYIDPTSGKFLGKPIIKSEFINWITSLHRSLFLKETGRFVVGIISILLALMAISGLILIIKRQKGFTKILKKINKDSASQYLHVAGGRLLLLPILFTTLTATYLFMYRFELMPKAKIQKIKTPSKSEDQLKLADFPIFKATPLSEVKKIEFPFIEDDPEESFIIKLNDKDIVVNQISGEVIESQTRSTAEIYEDLMLVLHTGKGDLVLAIILGISSLAILGFIYTGFAITLKRTKNKIKNKYTAEDAEIVILVGSENGSTLGFANHIHNQLLSLNKKSYLSELNKYQTLAKAQHLIIMTSSYGLGDAPTNANHFENLVEKHDQQQKIKVSIVGFGSRAYEDYCGYAEMLQQYIAKKDWAEMLCELHKVNDKSTHDFVEWTKEWSYKTLIPLATAPSLYQQAQKNLKTFKIVDRSEIVEDVTTFKIHLEPVSKIKCKSGDLLAIYPKNDHTERFYSIGKPNGKIQLVVKLHENGLGSGYLYHLKPGDHIKARIMENNEFHFPETAKKVVMIANGTGIAPFLGMIEEHQKPVETHLYCGFRKDSILTRSYQDFADEQISKKKLSSFHIAYSREENAQYVMDLVKRDAAFFTDIIKNKNYIMICGALKMQHDIEEILFELCLENQLDFQDYKNQGLLLADCY